MTGTFYSDAPYMGDMLRYLEASTRANTVRSYQPAVRHFEVDWSGHLPATADSVARYLTAYAAQLSVNTLKQRLTDDVQDEPCLSATPFSPPPYTRATTHYHGCPSAGYELLRFGRVLGPDALAASDQYRGRVPHIRQVRLGDQEVFIDLNAAGVQVYSDADFPHWDGWRFIEDDVNVDSRARSKALLDLIDPPSATPSTTPLTSAQVRQQQQTRFVRIQAALANADTQKKLHRCVVDDGHGVVDRTLRKAMGLAQGHA